MQYANLNSSQLEKDYFLLGMWNAETLTLEGDASQVCDSIEGDVEDLSHNESILQDILHYVARFWRFRSNLLQINCNKVADSIAHYARLND